MSYAPAQIACDGKVAFRSAALARVAANRRNGRMSYRCKFCGAWHVGGAKVKAPRARKWEKASRMTTFQVGDRVLWWGRIAEVVAVEPDGEVQLNITRVTEHHVDASVLAGQQRAWSFDHRFGG